MPAAARVVLIEGVGAARRSLADRLDVAVWVQSDYGEAKRRGTDRDMRTRGLDMGFALREWDEREAEEMPFLLDDRPWERTDVIAASAPVLAHDPATEMPLTAAVRVVTTRTRQAEPQGWPAGPPTPPAGPPPAADAGWTRRSWTCLVPSRTNR